MGGQRALGALRLLVMVCRLGNDTLLPSRGPEGKKASCRGSYACSPTSLSIWPSSATKVSQVKPSSLIYLSRPSQLRPGWALWRTVGTVRDGRIPTYLPPLVLMKYLGGMQEAESNGKATPHPKLLKIHRFTPSFSTPKSPKIEDEKAAFCSLGERMNPNGEFRI